MTRATVMSCPSCRADVLCVVQRDNGPGIPSRWSVRVNARECGTSCGISDSALVEALSIELQEELTVRD